MLEWVPRLVLMTVAVVVIAFLVTYYADRDVDEAALARAAYVYRIHYGNVIMYTDEHTKRVYPGTIDMSKFTSVRLDDVFVQRTGKRIASELTLSSDGVTTTIYNDKRTYDQYLPLAQNAVAGVGSATMETVTWPVTVKTGEERRPGTLKITVVRSNS